jgi:hypothetical protein
VYLSYPHTRAQGIPEFWLTALKNHLGISDLITERDEAVLKHLTDVRVEYLDGKSGFKLIFDFGPGAQEYFSNSQLEKTYIYQDEVGVGLQMCSLARADRAWRIHSTKAIWFMTMPRAPRLTGRRART